MIYPLDLTGLAVSNRVSNEQQHVSPPAEITHASIIVPNAAPFFYDSLKIRTGTNGSGSLLVEGVDYQLIYPFTAMQAYTGMTLYGAIRILNRELTQDLFLTYQTPGGQYTINEPLILADLQRQVALLSFYNWEDLTNTPSTFPPAFHLHQESTDTMQQVIEKLQQVAEAIANKEGGCPLPTYQLAVNKTTVDEGEQLTFSLITSGIPSGLMVGWQISGIQSVDLNPNNLTGQFVIGESGTDSFTLTVKADQLTEGNEVLRCELINFPSHYVQVNINDNSIADNSVVSATMVLIQPTLDGVTDTINTFNDYYIQPVWTSFYNRSVKGAYFKGPRPGTNTRLITYNQSGEPTSTDFIKEVEPTMGTSIADTHPLSECSYQDFCNWLLSLTTEPVFKVFLNLMVSHINNKVFYYFLQKIGDGRYYFAASPGADIPNLKYVKSYYPSPVSMILGGTYYYVDTTVIGSGTRKVNSIELSTYYNDSNNFGGAFELRLASPSKALIRSPVNNAVTVAPQTVEGGHIVYGDPVPTPPCVTTPVLVHGFVSSEISSVNVTSAGTYTVDFVTRGTMSNLAVYIRSTNEVESNVTNAISTRSTAAYKIQELPFVMLSDVGGVRTYRATIEIAAGYTVTSYIYPLYVTYKTDLPASWNSYTNGQIIANVKYL